MAKNPFFTYLTGAATSAPGGPAGSVSSPAPTGSAPVAPVSAIPPEARALLDFIAQGESSGQYDVRYSPQGGTKFTDTSTHPHLYETTPEGKRSSAAGRYQITYDTYNRMGGGDFGPDSQDAMAWNLAQQDYKARTGRDLLPDLKAQGITPTLQRTLAPTWTSLQNVADAPPQEIANRTAANSEGPPIEGGEQARAPQTRPPAPQMAQGRPRTNRPDDSLPPLQIEPSVISESPGRQLGLQIAQQLIQSGGKQVRGLRGQSPVARLTALSEFAKAMRGTPA